MKKKKWVPILLCAVLLVALCAIYFGLVKHNQKVAEEEEAAATINVLNMTGDDVNALTFTLDGKEETFTLSEDKWVLESDASFNVAKETMDSLVTSIAEMTADRKLENVEDLTEYGLDNPVQKAVLTTTDGTTHTIYWGTSNSMTSTDYIYVDDQMDTIYTISSTVQSGMSQTLDYFEETTEASEETTESSEE